MKRKPILLKRNLYKQFGKRQQVIGLMGAHHGAGVTHTGLLLAFYMGEELGKKTALLECNSHHDMNLIEETYEWCKEEGQVYSFRNITFYKDVSTSVLANRIPELMNDDYECLILDFGTDFISNRQEFLRCGKKIIIGGSAPWEQIKVEKFHHLVSNIKGYEHWIFLFPRADSKILARIRSGIGSRVYSVPNNPDPIIPTKYTCRLFDELIG